MTPTSESLVHSNKPTTADRLRKSFADREYADAYARSALNAYIATQIKVIREQRGWTQGKLADEAGMKQPRIAVMEDVDYSSWSITTLWRLAQAFHLRLKVSFEEFGTLPYEIETFDRKSLERLPLEKDTFVTWEVQQPSQQCAYIQAGGTQFLPPLEHNIVWVSPTLHATEVRRESGSWLMAENATIQPNIQIYYPRGAYAQTPQGNAQGFSFTPK